MVTRVCIILLPSRLIENPKTEWSVFVSRDGRHKNRIKAHFQCARCFAHFGVKLGGGEMFSLCILSARKKVFPG